MIQKKLPSLVLVSALALCYVGLLAESRAEPVIDAPTEAVPVGGFCDVTVRGLENPDSLRWTTEPETRVRVSVAWPVTDPVTPQLSLPTNKKGKWTLIVMYLEGEEIIFQKIPLVIGEGEPVPDPDEEEDDEEEDNDVDPEPTPGPMRVLFLREASGPTDAIQPLMSTVVREYLNSHTLKQNGTPEWRIWDDDYVDQNLEFISDTWKEAYADAKTRSNGQRPWVYLSNGSSGYSGPLPNTVDGLLILLKKYGGE